MAKFNRDSIIALALLVFSSILAWTTFYIRVPDYGTLSPAAWPQLVVASLALFSLIYFVQSINETSAPNEETSDNETAHETFFVKYQNPILCYSIYFLFLLTLPILGALIGGILLVFCLLSVMGGWSSRMLIKHALIATISMGFMWTLFTFGLRVILPQGTIFTTL